MSGIGPQSDLRNLASSLVCPQRTLTPSKATLGYLRALHDSLQDVQDLRTMLCMNGDLGLLSDLDVAELLLEASQLQDGQSVSAESLDLGASAQKRYPTLDAIIARNIHARQEQERKAAELKEQLQARKAAAEAEQANLEKICWEEQKEEKEKKEEEQKEEGGEPIKSAEGRCDGGRCCLQLFLLQARRGCGRRVPGTVAPLWLPAFPWGSASLPRVLRCTLLPLHTLFICSPLMLCLRVRCICECVCMS
eukprot:g82497.t1